MEKQEIILQQETKTTVSRYNYHDMLQYVSKVGKDLFGRDFIIDDVDKPVVTRLLSYFLKDKDIAAASGIDLKKGILLMGPVGCGKSALMKIMSNLCAANDRPVFRTCNQVVMDFNSKGYDSLSPYTKGAFFPYTAVPRVYCFDDLGLEGTGYYFGSNANVMADILLSRYNYFNSRKMITHVTTNMTGDELKVMYGAGISSRMREMFNQIMFSNTSRDKRS